MKTLRVALGVALATAPVAPAVAAPASSFEISDGRVVEITECEHGVPMSWCEICQEREARLRAQLAADGFRAPPGADSHWLRNKERTLKSVAVLRAQLIRDLGGRCANPKCRSREDLQFDHLKPRTWRARDCNRWVRMARYRRDAAAGLIQLLCGDCNRKKGKPQQELPLKQRRRA